MSALYTVRTLRGANAVSHKTVNRIESADGSRWAYSRMRKRSLGNRTYDIVESWVLKYRDADGKVQTEHGDAYEAHARQWVGEGA
jgi:hypothetical protein